VNQSSDERAAELRELFFESAQELLQALNEQALTLEKHPGDSESIRSIRRTVHTLKGDAAACGYRELSELAHEFEDALALDTVSDQAALAEAAFAAADLFSGMLAAYRHQAKLPSTDRLRKMVQQLSRTGQPRKRRTKKSAADVPPATTWTEYEKLAFQKAHEQGKSVYHVIAHIDPHCSMPIAARQLLVNALASSGEILASRPEVASESMKRLEVILASEKSLDHVTAKCKIPSIIDRAAVDSLEGPRKKTPSFVPTSELPAEATTATAVADGSPDLPDSAERDARSNRAPVTVETTLRVDADRIDSVMNLVGELIIGKSMFQQALNEFSKAHPRDAAKIRFADAIAFQARVLNDLQRSVMKIRMVPVEQLFRRFPRMLRDVAKLCDKDVQLAVSGEDTDLDKSLLDALAEPLTHLVRNAVSHGIEKPQERTTAGKASRGTVRLNAYHQGNQMIVEISDDGRGIDVQRVRAKAAEQGIMTAEESARLSEAAILELVFRPGFSTAEEVTEISGRGVGLDVVQSVLHRLKGTIEIDTRLGLGTTFRLKLPLTLAIIKALLFCVNQRLYAIPLNGVAEITRTNESQVHQVGNYEILQMRNEVLPLVRLGATKVSNGNRDAKLFVLVIRSGERKLGLIVDSLEGEDELVIKALDDQTVATDLVSGASILGDGRVVLVLNLAAIVDRFSKARLNENGITSGMLLSYADRSFAASAAGGQS
jgi:two-component system, chemotaxis family, sensor kinase CheA